MNALDKARDAGIQMRSWSDGQHATVCPWCSPHRRNKRAHCLSVLIDGPLVKFLCHHCGKSGGFHDDDQPSN